MPINNLVLEHCAEGIDFRDKIDKIDRVELCLDLSIGGITPSIKTCIDAKKLLDENNVELAIMARPLVNEFYHSLDYPRKLQEDIYKVQEYADSVVFGCLDKNGYLDETLIQNLDIEKPKVFHMAFDTIIEKHPKEHKDTVQKLIDFGFTRILTHGSPNLQTSVFDNLEVLEKTLNYANGKIEIMVGGGLTYNDAIKLDNIIKFDAYHGTKITKGI